MSLDGSARTTLGGLYSALSVQTRARLLLLIPALVLGVVAELASIGAVLPFLTLLLDKSGAAKVPGYPLLVSLVGSGSHEDLVGRALILLVVACALAAIMRLLILRLTQKFALTVAHDISMGMYVRVLRQPYSLYVARGSSEAFASVEKLQVAVSSVLMPIVQGAVAAVMMLFISLMLCLLNAAMAVSALALTLTLYLVASGAAHKRLKANSTTISEAATARMKMLQETIGSIRDILIDGSHFVFEDAFRRIDRRFRDAQGLVWFMGAAPRYIIEAAGVILLGLLALYMSTQEGGLAAGIPILGALALGAQRLIPLIQVVYLAVSNFTGNHQLLRDILALLASPMAPVASSSDQHVPPLKIRQIDFDRVSFGYDDRPGLVLRNVSLTIRAGERIGVVGATGSGKSTFFDLLMSLLEPTSGTIRVNEQLLVGQSRAAWQRQIAHVPQSIYLIDSSIEVNIALSRPGETIDRTRVMKAAQRAQIHDFIQALPSGYDTPVGERGIKLSGGERQRIAIARALYKGADVLILDEATSALDEETEAAVIEALAKEHPEVTILIATHRRSVLTLCDKVLRMKHGKIVADPVSNLPIQGSGCG